MNENDIRGLMEVSIPDLSDDEWDLLSQEGWVDDVWISETYGVHDLINRVRELRRTFGGGQSRSQARTPDVESGRSDATNTYARAISVLFGARARRDDSATGFRSSVLDGGFISEDEVENWITDRAAPMQRLLDEALGFDFSGPINWRLIPVVHYSVPDDNVGRVVPSSGSDDLEALRRVSEYLATMYRWGESAATIFALTRVEPQVQVVAIDVDVHPMLPAASRIQMTVDPALSPREVADFYARFRALGRSRRRRSLGSKHTELAIFRTLRPDGEAWAERLHAWNVEHPDWAYSIENLRNFRRDCATAIKRLLDPPLPEWTPWGGKT